MITRKSIRILYNNMREARKKLLPIVDGIVVSIDSFFVEVEVSFSLGEPPGSPNVLPDVIVTLS